jgi:hypothetical protein
MMDKGTTDQLVYFAYDLLFLNGRDLTREPLSDRKEPSGSVKPTTTNSSLFAHPTSRATAASGSRPSAARLLRRQGHASAARPAHAIRREGRDFHSCDEDEACRHLFIKDIQARYLTPEILGGKQVLGKGRGILKPVDQPTNRYGNLPRNLISRLRGRPDIFVGRVETKAGSTIGVWQRVNITRSGRQRKHVARGTIYTQQHGALSCWCASAIRPR